MDIERLLKSVEKNSSKLKYNQVIYEITEGDLLSHLKKSLAKEFSPKNLEDAITRAAPVNVLNKIFTKLSPLYSQDPVRTTEKEADQKLIDYYVSECDLNTHWNNANFNFNAYKNTCLELYHDERKRRLRTRSIPSMQFMAYSNNPIDPLFPTAIVKLLSKDETWVYTDEEFMIVNEKGEIQNGDTENPYQIIPFTYINKSSYELVPTIDSDTVQMALLVGKLLTDVNFSSKYLSNPIVYGIDISIDNLERSPNIFWNLKSTEDGKPDIGVVKTEADLQGQMDSLKQQIALWLQTRDIKAGTMGETSAEKASSGIALMIQEMDTTENVNKQKRFFEEAENDYWKRLAQIHNYLTDANLIDNIGKFADPEQLMVAVEYPEQKVLEDLTVRENRILQQLRDRVISKRRAIEKLNPKMSAAEVEELILEISEDGAINFGQIQPQDSEDDQ